MSAYDGFVEEKVPINEINVVCIDLEAVPAALAEASSLSKGLGMRMRLLFCQVVPWGLPLGEPPVSPRFVIRRILGMLEPLSNADGVMLQHVVCRGRNEASFDV